MHGRDLLGTPYLWGGGSSFGVDCSGFVQLLYALHGLLLPRDADQQFGVGVAVSRHGVQAGDLVFFATAHGKEIVHVGLAASRESVLHASGSGGVMESGIEDPVCGIYAGSRRVGEWSSPSGA
jgi:cell wall-associated NlpC family hydrolase